MIKSLHITNYALIDEIDIENNTLSITPMKGLFSDED